MWTELFLNIASMVSIVSSLCFQTSPGEPFIVTPDVPDLSTVSFEIDPIGGITWIFDTASFGQQTLTALVSPTGTALMSLGSFNFNLEFTDTDHFTVEIDNAGVPAGSYNGVRD